MLCKLVKANGLTQIIRVNEQRVVRGNFLNCISCWLAHEIIACISNVRVTGKKSISLTTYEDNFQDGLTLTAKNMTSQVTCSLTLFKECLTIFISL